MELPGSDLVEEWLADLQRGEMSIASLLVSIGRPRLVACGMKVPQPLVSDPETTLYEILAAEHGDDAHSRYNALIRTLVSYERALECAS